MIAPLTPREIARVATGLVRKTPFEWVQNGVGPFRFRVLALAQAGVEAVLDREVEAKWMETALRQAGLVGSVSPPRRALAVRSLPSLVDLGGHEECCCDNPLSDISVVRVIKLNLLK